ncbi:MAG: DUF6329 domain-containing protein [Lachnospiraceae bacterium]|nr:DUF6329 domain-containing protein [Ruminococcus sp.]MCM1276711.1 DUF6329 domain-containing protein [Lachnospiraceae bacterium]
MADNLILNADMVCKADRFAPKKCVVEKVIEVSDSEFKKFIETPMERNYYLPQYKEIMGFYDDVYHGVLFVNKESGDGILVNSEGADYARYSQYIPNARTLVKANEQTAALDALKTRMDSCVDGWLDRNAKADKFDIPLTDLINDCDLAEMFVNYASERLIGDPRIEDCELTHNSLQVTKRELVETRLYCPLNFVIESDEDGAEPCKVDSANYIDYDYEINAAIRDDLCRDEGAIKRGLAAYFHDENLAQKVLSAIPRAETRGGELYGVITVRSYGELNEVEMIDLVEDITGQLADGWGEGFEQRGISLGGDRVFVLEQRGLFLETRSGNVSRTEDRSDYGRYLNGQQN